MNNVIPHHYHSPLYTHIPPRPTPLKSIPPNLYLALLNLQIPLCPLHPSPTSTRTAIPAPPTAWSVNGCKRVSRYEDL